MPGTDPDATPGTTPDAGPAPDARIRLDANIISGIVISEVVSSPLNDWSVSDGPGDPFDGSRGAGAVSTRDQYIELHNRSGVAVSLIGWTIEVVDSSDGVPEVTPVAVSEPNSVFLTFSGSSSVASFQDGDFAVIGNPIGTVGDDSYIALKDRDGNIIDDVEIGFRDRENDGDDATAPGPNQNGFSNGSFEESISRRPDQADTDDDSADFIKEYATPLRPNVPPPPPAGDVEPPIAQAPAGADNWPVNRFVRVEMGEPLAAANIAPTDITLSVGGTNRAVSRVGFEDFDSALLVETTGVLPFGTNVTVTVAGSVSDRAGNALGSPAVVSFTTEAAPANPNTVILNEICVQAQQDWDHSSGGSGPPFSPTPGPSPSSVSSSDEWIELFVISGQSVDLTGFTIEVFNGPSPGNPALEVTTLTQGKVDSDEIQFFSSVAASLTSVPDGARVVVGNPSGSIDDDAYIVLRDANGVIMDEVEIGGVDAATDRGGDGIDNGAPEAGLNGNSTSLDDETVARSPNAADTGSDTGDWVHSTATLGQINN
ncbi:Ig-like domain-containing protein [Haliangium sp.]